uniref:Glutathione S-transferase n=1 Tax=Gossypium raimondii TaxID=29730 RepID=A0A0D2NUB9_GOSRA|nr:hypothetical protein B456_006G178700 [Gossypium raimondii]
MGEEVKVFGAWGSPFSSKVELALRLKGVLYDYIEEDLNNKSSLLLQYNPVYKKVPVLLHNGKSITESIIILEYIEETWKAYPILPQDPNDKAMARFWVNFIDGKCSSAIRKVAFSPEEEREKAVEEACECLKTVESALNGKKFFGGDTIGMGLELLSSEKFPNLFKWTDDFVSCSIVTELLPPRDKLVAHIKAHLSK